MSPPALSPSAYAAANKPPFNMPTTTVHYPLRLRNKLQEWRRVLPPSSPELKWIEEGYAPNFIDPSNLPYRRRAPHIPLAPKQKAMIATFIQRFLDLGIIRRVSDEKNIKFVSNIIIVQKEGKEDRPVVDLADLNAFTEQAPSHSLPSILELANIMPPTSTNKAARRRAAKLDISKMFYHVPIAEHFQPYLAVQFEEKFYQFVALPMGLQQSPFVTKKLLAAALAPLSCRSDMIVYVDDFLVTGKNEAQLVSRLRAVRHQLEKLGWTINEEKSSTSPEERLVFLGWQLDVTTAPSPTASLLPKRRQTIKKALRQLRNRSAPPPRFSQTLGLLVSTYLVDPTLAAALRPLHKDLARAVQTTSWRSRQPVPLSEQSRRALEFVSKSMAAELWSDRVIAHPDPPEIKMVTDASTEFGWGAVVTEFNQNETHNQSEKLNQNNNQPDEIIQNKKHNQSEQIDETDQHDKITQNKEHNQSEQTDENDKQIETAQDRWPTELPPDNPWLLPPVQKMIDVAAQARRSAGMQPIPGIVIARARALDRLPIPAWRPPRPNSRYNNENTLWHITYLETLASLYGLMVHAPRIAGRSLAIQSDATTAIAAWVRRSSPSPHINMLAWRLHLMLDLLGSSLASATHVPGLENMDPDEASRRWLAGREKLEWPLTATALQSAYLRLTGAPPHPATVDAFASSGNAKFPAFWSFKPDPRAEATDAFAQTWSKRHLFVNPPFELMDKVVDRLHRQRPVSALILTPEWPNRPWWQALDKMCPKSLLVHPKDVIEAGPTTNLAEPLRNPKWKLRFWWLPPT